MNGLEERKGDRKLFHKWGEREEFAKAGFVGRFDDDKR